MNTPILLRKVALAVFKDKKLLMVRSEDQAEVFYMLGGTVESGETDEECLIREVREEISCEIEKDSLEFLHEFQDIAHGRENTLVTMRVYRGEIVGEPTVSSEIVEITYVDSSVEAMSLSPIAINHIFPWLKEKRLIS